MSMNARIMTFLGMMTLPTIWAVGFIGRELNLSHTRATTAARVASTAGRSGAPPRERVIVSSGFFGCEDRDIEKKLSAQRLQDADAFLWALLDEAEPRRCRIWQQGESVTVQDDGGAAVCLRPTKGSSCYWTDRAAIED